MKVICIVLFISFIGLGQDQSLSANSNAYENNEQKALLKTSDMNSTLGSAGPQKVSINSSGKFNLNIPLLDVAGRNSNKVPVTLNYSPGVKVQDFPSWVGAGFNLELGSITRIPVQVMDYNVQSNRIPSSLLHFTERNEYGVRDYYSFSCPAGNGKIIQIPIPMEVPPASAYTQKDFRFELENYKNWKINYDIDKERFVILTDDGTTYVFGMALVGLQNHCFWPLMNGEYSQLFFPDSSPFMEWKLTAILGPDYVYAGQGDKYDPLRCGDPATEIKGNWVAIEYAYNSLHQTKWIYLSTNSGPSLLKEITYISKISTPTNYAEFITESDSCDFTIFNSTRLPWIYSYNSEYPAINKYLNVSNRLDYWNDYWEDIDQHRHYHNRRLKEIALFQKHFDIPSSNSTLLKKVLFKYYDGPFIREGFIKLQYTKNYEARTFLQQVIQSGEDGVQIPPYKFEYNLIAADKVPKQGFYDNARKEDSHIGYDGWYNGNQQYCDLYSFPSTSYNAVDADDQDGEKWNLSSITYPTGGKISFEYENDKVFPADCKSLIRVVSGGWITSAIVPGSARLKSQTIDDKIHPSHKFSYTYLSDNPHQGDTAIYSFSPLHYYVFHNFSPEIASGLEKYMIDLFLNQIPSEIQYSKIEEKDHSDNSRILSTYNVRPYDDFSVRLNRYSSRTPTNETIKQLTSDYDGSLKTEEYFDSDNFRSVKIDYSNVTKVKSEYRNIMFSDIPYWFSIAPVSNTKTTTLYEKGTTNCTASSERTYYNENALVRRKERDIVQDYYRFEELKYASDFAEHPLSQNRNILAIDFMVSRNILNAPIERIIGENSFSETTIGAAELTLYDYRAGNCRLFYPTIIYPSKLLQLEASSRVYNYAPFQIYNPLNGTDGAISYDDRYKQTRQMLCDDYGNIIESSDGNDVSSAIMYDNECDKTIALVKNAKHQDIFADNFEVKTGWDENLQYDNTVVHTGLLSGKIVVTSTTGEETYSEKYSYCSTKLILSNSSVTRKFRYSVWVNSNGPSSELFLFMEKQDGSVQFDRIQTNTVNQWVNLEKEIDVPAEITKLYVRVDNNGDNGGPGTVWFDDLRLYPTEGQMTTMTFDDKNLLTSVIDANNVASYVEYDSQGRQLRNKDYLGKSVSEINYSYLVVVNPGEISEKIKPNMIVKTEFINGNYVSKNWSFEEDTVGSTHPSGWVWMTDVKGNVTCDDSYLGGKAALLYKGGAIYQVTGLFKAGHTYTASVWFKAAVGTKGSLFFGNSLDLNNYDNSVHVTVDGNNNWQKITATIKMNADRDMQVCIYGAPDGTSDLQNTIYDNVIIEESPKATQPVSNILLYDGTLKNIQNQASCGNENIIQHLDYDTKGRLSKIYKKYQFASNNQYDPEYDSHAISYYNSNVYDGITDNYPYKTIGYYSDGRPKYNKPEGGLWQNQHFINYQYSIDNQPNGILKTRKIDENSKYYDEYIDRLGRKLCSVSDAGGVNFTNSFSYDILDNITKISTSEYTSEYSSSAQPVGRASIYEYNTLGQLTLRNTPDNSLTKYLYDKNGNVRFIADGNSSTNHQFTYHRYDKFNNLIEVGRIISDNTLSDFNSTNSNLTTFPNSGMEVLYRFSYGVAVQPGQNNLTGRLSCSEELKNGSIFHQTFYSYNQFGFADWVLHVFIKSDQIERQVKIYYAYDTKKNVVKKSYQDETDVNNKLFTFYNYDEAGRLSKVFTSVEADGKSKVKEAEFSYFASGNLKRLQLGSAQGMDYRYNERDLLTFINHQNLTNIYQNNPQDPGRDGYNGIPGDKFGEAIGYSNIEHVGGDNSHELTIPQYNGNISWNMYNMSGVNTLGAGVVGWRYDYDGLNRLKSSEFDYYTSHWQYSTGDMLYNMSAEYDLYGNIKKLQRISPSNQKKQLDYIYQDKSNRLVGLTASILQLGGTISDVQNFSYSYDENGNVINDSKRNLSEFHYNINNLPEQLTDGLYRINNYLYDSNGNRIRKMMVQGAPQSANSPRTLLSDEIYILGADGQTEAVYDQKAGKLKFWNISAGGHAIGRINKY